MTITHIRPYTARHTWLRLGALALGLVAFSGCKKVVTETSDTGVLLTITYDTRLALDQVSVSATLSGATLLSDHRIPNTTRALNPKGETVTIIVRDQFAGDTLALSVSGLTGGTTVVTAAADVPLLLHQMVPATINLAPTCVVATDCPAPLACQDPTNIGCSGGACVYGLLTTGTPCTNTTPCFVAAGTCDASGDCQSAAVVCNPPAGSVAVCFSPVCTAGACQNNVNQGVTCLDARCTDGLLAHSSACAADGSCPTPTGTSCGGWACAADGQSCLSKCVTNADCDSTHYCDSGGPNCVALLANGSTCGTGSGASATCQSGYCENSICCAPGGDCCKTSADCPASTHTCPFPSTCQGNRVDSTCGVGSNQCGTQSTDDDSGCTPLVGLDCSANHFKMAACTGAVSQTAPTCPTTCPPGVCADGYICNGGSCTLPLGVGNACTGGPGQGTCATNLVCVNSICCAAGGVCCTVALQSTECSGGLACNGATSSCYTSCTLYGKDQCASASNYCDTGSHCAPKQAPGATCSDPGSCVSNSCTENVCCENACTAVCASCLAINTGAPNLDGQCRAVKNGSTDNQPSPLCTASGTGCTGTGACACDGLSSGAADCKAGIGHLCSVASDCASGFCECADTGLCPAHRCVAALCNPVCAYTTTGSNCVQDLGDPSDVTEPACSGNQICHRGQCLKIDGQTCTADSQCLHTCIGSPVAQCAPKSSAGGPCDAGDNADCVTNYGCSSANVCKLLDLQGCTADSQCVNTCIQSACHPPSNTGGTCDTGDNADCVASPVHTCQGNKCLRVNGQACTADTDCANVCINGFCAPISGAGGPCDVPAHCSANLTCVGTPPTAVCLLNAGQTCTGNGQCASSACSGRCCSANNCSGSCEQCDASGACTFMPANDATCGVGGVIDCSSLNTNVCRTYSNITTAQCATLGNCKTASPATCPYVNNAGTVCGLCEQCDASGGCTAPAADDANCGSIDCSAYRVTPYLPCTTYGNITTSRCAGIATCKTASLLTCPPTYNAGAVCGSGLCAAQCDSSGGCTATPADDVNCGNIDCSGLNAGSPCRTYNNLTSNRCLSVGTCKLPNQISSCTSYNNLTSLCRAGTPPCDPAEYCDGVSPTCPADISNTPNPNNLLCAPGPCTPTINGDLSDSCWASATWQFVPHTNAVAYTPLPTTDADASFYVTATYDSSYLYFAFKVSDDVIKRDTAGPNFYNDDCIELYFDMGDHMTETSYLSQGDVGLQFLAQWISGTWDNVATTNGVGNAQNGPKSSPCVPNATALANTKRAAIAATLAVDGYNGYKMEMQVPLVTNCWNVAPSPTKFIGFSAHMDDDDGNHSGNRDNALAWGQHEVTLNQDCSWTNPTCMGLLVFCPQ